jgi:hypothetical protein
MTAPTLDLRALNRATLARQLLLERADLTVTEAVTRLGGLQAQTPHTWYAGLWSRLRDYSPAHTSSLLEQGELVRIALMRSTIHLVTVSDCSWMRPLVEPVIIRSTLGAFGRHLRDLDRPTLESAARAALATQPMILSELGRALAPSFPGRDPAALAQAARMWLPLAQTPPRGLWGRSGRAAHTVLELKPSPAAPADLFLRYLGAFGPASVRDAQQWSGLTRLSEVAESLRPELIVFRGPDGRELFDLPDAPRPPGDAVAPTRFLYDFDNLLLSHADRSRVVGGVDYGAQGWGGDSMEQPRSVLVDGFVAATWRIAVTRKSAVLTVRPFRRLSAAETASVEAEGLELARFHAPTAAPSVTFTD